MRKLFICLSVFSVLFAMTGCNPETNYESSGSESEVSIESVSSVLEISSEEIISSELNISSETSSEAASSKITSSKTSEASKNQASSEAPSDAWTRPYNESKLMQSLKELIGQYAYDDSINKEYPAKTYDTTNWPNTSSDGISIGRSAIDKDISFEQFRSRSDLNHIDDKRVFCFTVEPKGDGEYIIKMFLAWKAK